MAGTPGQSNGATAIGDRRPLRVGALAAARITGPALIEPARHVEGVEVVAVAARDGGRAAEAAAEWDVPRSFGSYDDLIADAGVDAVYVATPASWHRPWAVAAIEAGKHVLVEKPFAANAADARRIAEVAAVRDVVVMEAFHWRYHPFAASIAEGIESIGAIRRVDAAFHLRDGHVPRDDIRWELSIGGGATMDLGCYPLQWVRFVAGSDVEVVSASAECPVPEVDAALTAELRWPSGATGSVSSSMIADETEAWLRVTGERGVLLATNPLAPQRGAELRVEIDGDTTVTTPTERPTYEFQLEAFRDAVTAGTPFPTTAADGVAMMELVDACYRAAGLAPRPGVTAA